MIRRVDRGVLAGAAEALGRFTNTDEQRHKAVYIIAGRARDAAELVMLCQMAGLDPREARPS